MRIVVPILCGLFAALAAAPAGDALAIEKAPYQVAVLADGALCGGAILSPSHIATAAHCVISDDGTSTKPPWSVVVRAGNARRSLGTSHAVERVSLMPDYDGVFRHDAAILRLAVPLTLQPGVVETITPATSAPAAGELFVSGWGDTSGPSSTTTLPAELQGVALTQRSDTTCSAMYGSTFQGSVMLCAGDTLLQRPIVGRDACGGDSGGPLTDGSASAKGALLHGLVSFGPSHCGEAYGVYTEVAAPAVRSFLTSDPPDAPRPGGPAALSGLPVSGSPLTCDPGTWSGGPATLTYQFLARQDAGLVALTAPSGTATFVPGVADVGREIVCVAEARNAGGWGTTASAPVQIAAARSATGETPAPAPPAPLPVPAPAEPPAATDLTPPVARVSRARCSRRGCVLRVRVTDIAPSAGVRGISVKLRSTLRRCRGKRCRRTRTLVARSVGARSFSVVARAIRRGTHRFTIVAVDAAGNRQPIATRRTLSVR